MATIGKVNTLSVVKQTELGVFLHGEEHGQILLPRRYVSQRYEPGDTVEVFLYMDSEDRPIATTLRPYAMVGELATLKVVSTTNIGAFLDWGLPKDLFVPVSEQKERMQVDDYYVVYIYTDEQTGRLAASARLNRFLSDDASGLQEGQKVTLHICEQTDLGFKSIIDGKCWGLLYGNEVFEEVFYGDIIDGYIKKIREDGKIDLSLHPSGYEKIEGFSKEIYDLLQENNGYLPLHDKSSPEKIAEWLGMSKKNFKKSIGSLYKQRLISIDVDGIRLLTEGGASEEG